MPDEKQNPPSRWAPGFVARFIAGKGETYARLWFDTMRNLLIISVLYTVVSATGSKVLLALLFISIICLAIIVLAPSARMQLPEKPFSVPIAIVLGIVTVGLGAVALVFVNDIALGFVQLLSMLGRGK